MCHSTLTLSSCVKCVRHGQGEGQVPLEMKKLSCNRKTGFAQHLRAQGACLTLFLRNIGVYSKPSDDLWHTFLPLLRSLPILFVAHRFHPVRAGAIEMLINGDVHHGGSRRGAMPMLFTRRDPDHVSGPDFFNRSAPALHPPAAGGDNQMLTQRVGMPG